MHGGHPVASPRYIRVWIDAQDLNEGIPSRFGCCVDADRRECVWTWWWVAVCFGGQDGGLVSIVGPWWASCGFSEVPTGEER